MTPKYEDRYGGRKGKTLDDIYDVVRSIDSKVKDLLDELGELECETEENHDWDMGDFYDDTNGD